MTYDAIVIGIGLIGSAALRHLSKNSANVLGLGPDEPTDWQNHEGVFASYYDQGRITRRVDPDPIWALLGARSIDDYTEIEAASGIQFHGAVGCLRVSGDPSLEDDNLPRSRQHGLDSGAVLTDLAGAALKEAMPMLAFPNGANAVFETGGAGYVNPRELVRANLTIAQTNGATLVRDQAHALTKTDGVWTITGTDGDIYRAANVLIATGAFTNGLLKPQLQLRPRSATTLLARISENEAERLAGMPSIIYRVEANPDLYSIYALPPIRYPDGHLYVKIGGTFHEPLFFDDQRLLQQWYRGHGEVQWHDLMWQTLSGMIPDLDTDYIFTRPCSVTYTAHGQAYVDQVDDGIYVAVGGCGAAAKSSPEIGKMAALMVENEAWRYDISQETFRAV